MEYLLGALVETLAANKFPSLQKLTVSGNQLMLPQGPLEVPCPACSLCLPLMVMLRSQQPGLTGSTG